MKFIFKIYLTFILITGILSAEFRLPAQCNIYFSNKIVSESLDSGFHEVQIPDYLFNYENIPKRLFANYIIQFEGNDKFFRTIDSLFLIIPSLASVDQTYLNGKLIGKTGIFPPNFKSGFNDERIYYIPKSYLLDENELLITLYSPDINGGILSETPVIYTSKELKEVQAGKKQLLALPISNGISTARFHTKECYFSNFYPHLYQRFNENILNKPVLEKLTPRIYKNGVPIDLQPTIKSSKFVQGTGIVQINGNIENDNYTILGFCPFTEEEPLWIFYILIEGENLKQYIPDIKFQNPDNNLHISKEVFSNQKQKWLRIILHYKTENHFSLTKYKNLNTNFDLLKKELKWWKNWQKSTNFPENLNEQELSLYIQSLVLMKMAQVNEDFPAKGQIVSSFPPHENRTNLFDQAVIIDGFLKSGHNAEAIQCLQYLLRGKCSKHRNLDFVGNNVGLLNNYALSINNYYGNSEEQSINPENSVISLAGFGLILTNIRNYLELTDDIQFLEYYWEKIYREIALVLVNLIDNTDLVREDAGLFEKPLPGTHNTSTSAIIYKGLVDVAWMGRMLNQETATQEFEFYANKIRLSIEDKLWKKETKEVRASLEGRTKDIYIDASITSLINCIYTPQDEICNSVINTLQKELSIKNSPLIYSKYEYNYFNKEISLFCNLRFAENYYRLKSRNKGDEIINFIVNKI